MRPPGLDFENILKKKPILHTSHEFTVLNILFFYIQPKNVDNYLSNIHSLGNKSKLVLEFPF